MKLNSGTCGIPPWCLFCQSGHCLCFKSLLWFSQLLFPVKTFQSIGKKSENSLLGANIWWYEGAHVVFSHIQSRIVYCTVCVCESMSVCELKSKSSCACMCACIHYFSYMWALIMETSLTSHFSQTCRPYVRVALPQMNTSRNSREQARVRSLWRQAAFLRSSFTQLRAFADRWA